MVVKFSLPFNINLDLLEFVLENVDYRQKRFNGAIAKCFDCCMLIFENGKVNIVGVKSLMQADNAIVRLCQALDQSPKKFTRTIVNLVATSSLGRQLNLYKVMQKRMDHFEHYPELYPAVYYKVDKAKVLIFHTGKLVFTGFKDFTHVCQINEKLKILLNEI